MKVLRDEALARWTTFAVGGPAERFVLAETEADLVDAVREVDARGEPLTILGGGSNVLVADEGLRGTVVRVASRGVTSSRDGDRVTLTAAAGEPWDDLVARAVSEGLAGVECLAGIPGLVGATPVQNVGAYGQEVSDTLTAVRVWDRVTSRVETLSPADCAFGYRDSAFKRDPSRRRVVLDVTFSLTPAGAPRVRYGELSRALTDESPSLAKVRETVIALRRAKGMVHDPADPDSRGAGSFFTNPVVDRATADAVEAIARQSDPSCVMPRFDAGEGRVKLAAGWLIERAGISRGLRLGRAAVSRRHCLALVNPEGDASAREVIALARHVRDTVHGAFGVMLAPEVMVLGFGAADMLPTAT